jgi:tetratricopeptide (TPR) repeat protein
MSSMSDAAPAARTDDGLDGRSADTSTADGVHGRSAVTSTADGVHGPSADTSTADGVHGPSAATSTADGLHAGPVPRLVPDAAGYLRTVATAEARTESGMWAEAAMLWERTTRQNPLNGNLWDRLAEARYENGDFGAALAAYEKARDLGVWHRRDEADSAFRGVLAYRIATCHARLGASADAVSWLERAIDEGLRDLDEPRSSPAWEELRSDDRVKDLLGIIDQENMPRAEGWRSDVAFFAREVKRRAYAPWQQITEAEFDNRIGELIAAIPGRSDAEIMTDLMRLLVPMRDGHAWVAPPPDADELRLTIPVAFYHFAEGTFVTAADPEYRALVGARVLEVAGRPVDDVLAALEPLISRDNSQQAMWTAGRMLRWSTVLHALGLVSDPRRVELKVRYADGSTGEQAVSATSAGSADFPAGTRPAMPLPPRPTGWTSLPDTLAEALPIYLRNATTPFWYEYLRDHGLVYLQINGIRDHPAEELGAFCDRVFAFIDSHPVERLVIDLRWNGGGNTLLTQRLLHHLIGCRKINQPGSLFVIIGRGTFSAAQNTATAIERETHAIFAGEPSGSCPNFIGESIPFQLPYSKMLVNVADLYWQTSWPIDYRTWIAPDIYAPPTFAAYARNIDPALEAILAATEHLPGY